MVSPNLANKEASDMQASGRGSGRRKRGHWSVEEDVRLLQAVNKYGEGRWSRLARAAGLQRCGKSCRLRWVNYLRPDVKRGHISEEEERLIIQLHSAFGNKWSLIAVHLPGRSDNEIKNYWRSHIQKKFQCPDNVISSEFYEQPQPHEALTTSPSTLQLPEEPPGVGNSCDTAFREMIPATAVTTVKQDNLRECSSEDLLVSEASMFMMDTEFAWDVECVQPIAGNQSSSSDLWMDDLFDTPAFNLIHLP